MDLTNGTYIIRYVPQGASPDDVGGVYASSKDGPSKPVTVEPLGPEGKIYWRINKMRDEDGEAYSITVAGTHGEGKWARSATETDVPVLLFDIRMPPDGYVFNWKIQKDGSGDGTYNIMGNVRIGSTDWVDLREEQHELFMRPVPVIPDVYIPRWKITRSGD